MTPTNGKIYEFGDFRLQPAENILEHNGQLITLKPKAFLTLVCLVESAGKLVEKNVLLNQVWENSFVEEASVSKCIWEIRAVLDDDPKNAKFIQTVPKRGYRFIGDVKLAKGDLELKEPKEDHISIGSNTHLETNIVPIVRSGSVLAEPKIESFLIPVAEASHEPENLSTEKPRLTMVPRSQSTSNSTKYWVSAIVLLIIAGGLIYYFYPTNTIQTASGKEISTLAILPLKPVVAGARDENVEFAIADALIIKAGEAKNLDVKRLFAVRKYTDLTIDPIVAGRELHVDYVLASTYQIADDRVRVMSELINVSTGNTEQKFRSEVKNANIFEIQDVVSKEIGNALLSRFGRPASDFALKRGTDNEKAYEKYLEAIYLVDKFTRDDSAKAVDILDQAINLDPNFAAALAVKAQAYCQFAHLGGGRPDHIFSIARPSLDKALALDKDNAVALTISGMISLDYYWNLPDAYSDLKRAVLIDPNSILAHRVLAGAYYRDGRFFEALEEQKKAVDLNPTDIWDKWFLADYQVAAGSRDEGIANLERLTEIDPSFQPSYYSLWRTYLVSGNKAKAFEYFIKNKQSWQDTQSEIDRFQKIYETSGWDGVLNAELELMRSNDRDGTYSTRKIYIAELASQLGQNDLAFRYLEEALKFRLLGCSYIKVNPLFDPIRKDPRYTEILSQTKL